MTTPRYRPFGRTGWDVSEVSFGAWQLGGQWGKVDDAESVSTLLAAYEAGINFVDTAQMYGLGHSESVVGRSLHEWGSRDRIYVATKVQPVQWPAVDDADPRFGPLYPRQYLIDQVEGSLQRLDSERIDLLQLHCWAPDGLHDLDWLETLSRLREAGKVDRIGVSIRDYRPDDGVELAKSGLVDSIQVIYNIFEQQPAVDLFPAAADSGTAIIARVALDSGALGGRWTRESYETWEEGSMLHGMFRGERFRETLERVEALKEVTEEYYESLAEAAVRFAVAPAAVSTTILGMTTSRRLTENLAFSDGASFPEELRARLTAFQWRRNYYT